MRVECLRKNRLLVVAAMSFIMMGQCSAVFDFASPSSKLVLGDFNGGVTAVAGYFKTNAQSGIIGFDQQSIVRGTSQSNTISNAWTCTIGTGTIGSTGGSRFTRDLILTTSDAAVGGGGTSVLLRTTSNSVNVHASSISSAQSAANSAGSNANAAYNLAQQAQIQVSQKSVTTSSVDDSVTASISPFTQLNTLSKVFIGSGSSPITSTGNGGLSWQNGSWITVPKPAITPQTRAYVNYFDHNAYGIKPPRAAVTMDANGGNMSFGSTGNDLFSVQDNTAFTFQNITLQDFRDDAFQVGHGSIVTFGDGTIIKTASAQKLLSNWVCKGDVTINGQDSSLDLNGHVLSIAAGGSLTLENITLDGVNSKTLVCNPIGHKDTRVVHDRNHVHDTRGMSGVCSCEQFVPVTDAVVRLRNVRLNFNDLYTFRQGVLVVERDVVLAGTGGFVYGSDQQSFISANSTLKIENGITFGYAPTTNNRDLIAFEDSTAQLFLNGCQFVSTTTGMRLTKGTLLIDSNNNLHNDGAKALSEGIVIGNGVAADDLHIEYMPGASLNVVSGILTYENVDSADNGL